MVSRVEVTICEVLSGVMATRHYVIPEGRLRDAVLKLMQEVAAEKECDREPAATVSVV